jgi:hypothetical protein
MNLTLDDLYNIRFALNEKIHAMVMKGVKDGAPIGPATKYAETRDKIQAEIDQRTTPPA